MNAHSERYGFRETKQALWLAFFLLALAWPCQAATVVVDADITLDATWSGANTYHLTGNIKVRDGATLTIEAGTVIKINSGGFLDVDAASALRANGTGANPIYITSRDDNTIGETLAASDGDPLTDRWVSVEITPGGLGDGTIANFTYTKFRYGGGNQGVFQAPMVRMRKGGAPVFDHCEFFKSSYQAFGSNAAAGVPLEPTFTSCVFQENDHDAIYIQDNVSGGVSTPKIHGCRFDGNGADGETHAAITVEDNVFIDWGDATNTVEMTRDRGLNGVRHAGSITAAGAWSKPGAAFPYLSVANLEDGGALTIGPGVVVKFAARDGWEALFVRRGASLTVNGTQNAPVYFTSIRDDSVLGDTNGNASETLSDNWYWLGVYFEGPDVGKISQGSFTYAKFSYGGGLPGVYQKGMVECAGASPTFDHCDFYKSKYVGVQGYEAGGAGASPEFYTCSFRENARSGIMIEDSTSAAGSTPVISACSFSGNGTTSDHSAIQFYGNVFPDWAAAANTVEKIQGKGLCAVTIDDDITVSGAWNKPGDDFPYSLGFSGGDVWIKNNATVTAGPGAVFKLGNRALHIEPGAMLNVAGAKENEVIFTSLYDDAVAGDTDGDGGLADPVPGDWDHLRFSSNNGGAQASGTINHAIFRYGGGLTNTMMYIDGCAPVFKNCQFLDSQEWAVRAWRVNNLAPAAKINNCLISGNKNGVENNDDRHALDATNNDWGHYSGPKDESDADDLVHYYNPTALGQTISDNVLVEPWIVPEGTRFIHLNANLQARVQVGGDAALALDLFTDGLSPTSFSLSLDLTEAPGVTVDATKSTHAHPYTADTFTGAVVTYYLSVGDSAPRTVEVIVNAVSNQESVRVRLPMRIEAKSAEANRDVNGDGIIDAADVTSLVKYLVETP